MLKSFTQQGAVGFPLAHKCASKVLCLVLFDSHGTCQGWVHLSGSPHGLPGHIRSLRAGFVAWPLRNRLGVSPRWWSVAAKCLKLNGHPKCQISPSHSGNAVQFRLPDSCHTMAIAKQYLGPKGLAATIAMVFRPLVC